MPISSAVFPLTCELRDGQRLRNGTRQYTSASALSQLRTWSEHAAELTVTVPDEAIGGTAYNVVFMRGSLRVSGAPGRYGERPGYLASFVLIEV